MAVLDTYLVRLHYEDGSIEEVHYSLAFTVAMFAVDSLSNPNLIRLEIIPPVWTENASVAVLVPARA
jgi:hypothetical protein